VALGLAVLLGGAGVAGAADNTGSLMRQLREDTSYKVRLSAALQLGKRGDRRAIPALVGALGDEVSTIRAVAAGALGKLVDAKVDASVRRQALARLVELRNSDPEKTVREAARGAVEAIERIEERAAPRPLKNSIYVRVDEVGDSTRALDAEARATLTEMTEAALLDGDPSIITQWPGSKPPSARALRKARARRAFSLMSTVSDLTVEKKGRRATVKCKLKLVLSTYPAGAIRAFFNGAAGIETSNEAASIERAKQRCAGAVTKHLMKSQVIPDVTSGGE
jgi:hypothetical protein